MSSEADDLLRLAHLTKTLHRRANPTAWERKYVAVMVDVFLSFGSLDEHAKAG